MPRVYDLPDPAISSIIQRARPRCIPGTNKYALVCRSWRDAGTSDDSEQLHLLLDLDNLKDNDLDSSLAWLQQHGGCVTNLYIRGIAKPCWYVMQQLLVAPDTFSSTLTRLELEGRDTLVPLAPHLHQLPSLRHLSASITCGVTGSDERVAYGPDTDLASPPDLCQHGAQLTSLHLKLQRHASPLLCVGRLDAGMWSKLPTGLQQLTLQAQYLKADIAHLTHLTALARLTLDAWGLHSPHQLVSMGCLQQLELSLVVLWGMDLVPLAGKLVGLEVGDIPAATLRRLRGLTSLSCAALEAPAGPQERPQVNPLLDLTSLRMLRVMDADNRDSSWLLEGLFRLSSLRGLCLLGSPQEEVLALVGKVTQLTELELLTYGASHPSPSSRSSLLQLTGLQRLVMKQEWLLACGTELSALSLLTQLVVLCQGAADPEQLLSPLSGLLPALQQVVCVYAGGPAADLSKATESAQPATEVALSPLPGVRVTLTDCAAPCVCPSIVRPQRTHACPHLPRVWEVLA